MKYAKTSVKISENSTINKSLSQIKVGLKRDDDNIFTPDFYQIHFQIHIHLNSHQLPNKNK